MLGVLRLAVQGQEGVGVARRTVTQAVAFLQQAEVPHHFSTAQGLVQVLRHPEGLHRGPEPGRKEESQVRQDGVWSM